MAPFLTHLVIGERLWAEMSLGTAWADQYGTFLFGCLAPDVDKFCDGLSQAATHFMAKDAAYTWIEQRTRIFLDRQAELLRAPFCELSASEQAFVAGYLSHVAADEVTGRYGRATRQSVEGLAPPPRWVDAFLTAFEPRAWALARDPGHILANLGSATIPDGTLPFIPARCLQTMYRLIWPQIRDGGGLIPYLAMVRLHRYWRRHAQTSDEPRDPEIEAEVELYRQQMEAALPIAEKLLAQFDMATYLEQAVEHSRERVAALLAAEEETS